MQITGKTRVYMIFGDPVHQVRAPVVFNYLFQHHGVDAVLVPLQVPLQDSAKFVQTMMHSSNAAGLWLTIPHKTPIIPLLERTDRMAALSGAVNAVRRGPDGRLEGALFDGLGFVRALAHHGLEVRGKCALIVGAGGAGLAIATALAEHGVDMLHVADLDASKAQAAVQVVEDAFSTHASAVTLPTATQYDIVVNATPIGLKPSDPLPFEIDGFDTSTVVIDILMPKSPTRLLQACERRGIRAFDGHEMLVQQVPDYLRYFGHDQIADAVASDLGVVRKLISSN